MIKTMIVVAVAMLIAVCHGTAIYYDGHDASNVDCSYAQALMRKAEEKQIKLTDDEKSMLQIATVHCSSFVKSSNEEGTVIRQWGPSMAPTPEPTRPSTFSSRRPPNRPPNPPGLGDVLGNNCQCKCMDRHCAIRECRKSIYEGCDVIKGTCTGSKYMCC